MTREQEVARLTRVDQSYQRNRTVQAQWAETNRGNEAILQDRNRHLRALLAASPYWPLTQRSLLEIGYRIAAAQQAFLDLHFQQVNASN